MLIQQHCANGVDAAFNQVEGQNPKDCQCEYIGNQRVDLGTHGYEIAHILSHQCHIEGNDDIQVGKDGNDACEDRADCHTDDCGSFRFFW